MTGITRPSIRAVEPLARLVGRIVLISEDELALWVTHWPQAALALDGIDALRCTVFRREGRRHERGSVLIEAAITISEDLLGRAPGGWITYVEPSKIRSIDPGHCFKMAGFEVDHAFQSTKLIRLRRPQ